MRGVAIGAVLLGTLACTGAVGGNAANRDACERYVAHMNTLTPCMGVHYDPDNLCSSVHQTTVDMTGYYDCLRQNSSCDGVEPVLDLDGCMPPTEEAG